MTSIGSPSPFFFGRKKVHEVERSLRFNDNDSAYLARTPSSNSNRKTWSLSFWFKRATLGITQNIFCTTGSGNSTFFDARIQSNDTITLGLYTNYLLQTNQVFRDPSAWYHMVVVLDSTQATASNRLKWYINGNQITSFSIDNISSLVTQNVDFGVNSTAEMTFGKHNLDNDKYFDGYITEINHIDGSAYDPSYFAETDSITGQWIPKKYVGSYGTNGFYLNFSDNSGTTATTLGKDSSGNGNNFTPNNFSVYDSMPDTPTNNFAVMNPLTNYSGLSQGNLRFNNYNDSAGNRSTQATFALPKSGKWYLEARYQEDYVHSIYMGLSQIQMNTGYLTNPSVYYDSLYGTINATGESAVSGGGWYNIGSGNSVILSMAIDVDNNSVKFYKDNSLQGTITLPTITSLQEYFFTWANSSGGSSVSMNNTFNFGADSTFQGQETSGGNADANGIGDFKYAPPSGHLALCSANLPNPTILKPNKHFDTFLYSGDNNATRTFSNVLEFQTDFFWTKARNVGYAPIIIDSVRGTGQLKSLATQSNALEGNELDNATYGYINSFDATGFSVTKGSASSSFTNESGKIMLHGT